MPERITLPDASGQQPVTKIYKPVVGNRVYIAQYFIPPPLKQCRCFRTPTLKYIPFCDDFGPMNMASVIRFVEMLDSELSLYPSYKIVYCIEPGRRAMTNAAFLLGAYMILKLDMTTSQVEKSFTWLEESMTESFRDATFSTPNFALTLNDCWRGLERGKAHGWVRSSTSPGFWGQIDVDCYEFYDDPYEADLHEVIPGKFVALKGPKDLGGRSYADDERGYRNFSPAHYVSIFKTLGVSAVVQLNECSYDSTAFKDADIAHHDLQFKDCTAPTPDIVDSFLKIADSCPGTVAVHCRAGLGRTGTLIALYMMRSYGFTAREAMGWLRIMRPGCVIGDQQNFLVAVERSFRQHIIALPAVAPGAGEAAAARPPPAAAPAPPAPRPPGAAGAASAEALAAQVTCGMERRGVERARQARPSSAVVALPALRTSK